MGGPVFKVAGGDASECSVLLESLAWVDFANGFDIWVEGGGVMAPARAGKPSWASLLLPSLARTGLVEGLDPFQHIEDSGFGVRGTTKSDILLSL